MKKVSFATECIQNIEYNITNHLVSNFPIWGVRKLYYKLRGMKIGKGSYILRGTVVRSPKKIVIGERTIINEYCFLDGRSGIEIGNDVTIAVYSKLISGGHVIDDDEFGYTGEKITIGDNVAVFADAIVLAGARLKLGTVISAGSVVKKGEYGPLKVYCGNPAIYLRERKSAGEYHQDYWHPVFR